MGDPRRILKRFRMGARKWWTVVHPFPAGKSRDLAAKRAQFDSGKQLDRATNVVKFGAPALVEAMDRGDLSITAAAEIAKAAPSEHAAIVAMPEPARIEEMRRRKTDEERVREDARDQETRNGRTAYTAFLLKHGRIPDEAEAKRLADVDWRETPDAAGKRHKPGAKPTKEERAEAKRVEGYHNDLWNIRQALHHLVAVEGVPAVLVEHMDQVDRNAFEERLALGRSVLNAFAQEYRRHGK